MIYVTQGHELGIGTEVFLKSFSLLSPAQQQYFTLVADLETITKNLDLLKYNYKHTDSLLTFNSNSIKIIDLPNEKSTPQSTLSLNIALKNIKKDDILLTLPTSKDQLIDNGILRKGYTEFLRHRYERDDLCMVFKAYNDATLLITDHIPLSQVPSSITTELIVNKVRITVEGLKRHFYNLDEVILSGINPHCGEGGLLGTEDNVIIPALKSISKYIHVIGPVSGDTLHFHTSNKSKQLKVYMYHDQGLPIFKDKYRTIGLNITFGLPFLRMSVDHGTAFEIYGKNIAEFSGCYYMLKEAIKVHRKSTNE